ARVTARDVHAGCGRAPARGARSPRAGAARTRRRDQDLPRPTGRPMTSWRRREAPVHQIVTLARDGLSRRAITRATGVSLNTVRAVLATHQRGRTEEHAALRPRPARAPRASRS